MPNPIHIPAVFAVKGNKNPIQKSLQSGQDLQDMTWTIGTPAVTMVKIEDGGLAPKGQDFNGVLNAFGENIVHTQNGGRYKWSQDVITNYRGYSKGSIIQSDDETCCYRSLVNSNTVNPNTGVGSSWIIYSGAGSVPIASSTISGTTKVVNALNSTDVSNALSAAQGKILNDTLSSFINAHDGYFGVNGYLKVPIGNTVAIMQWGTTDAINYDTSININFPIAFPVACINITASPRAVNAQSFSGATSAYTSNVTRFGVTLTNDSSTPRESFAISWFAIGY